MNKILLLGVIVSTLFLQACNHEESAEAGTAETNSVVALDTSAQKISYGIAYGFGQRLKMDEIPIDVAAFSAGMRDAMGGAEPLMTEQQMAEEMQAFQMAQSEKMQAKMEETSTVNMEAGKTFLAENAQKEGVVTLDSGLQYKVIEAAEGANPAATDTVEVHYRGALLDGTEFDSSYSRGQSANFGVGQVIPGFSEALQLMSVGSKWQVYIPSDLGYGPGGTGGGPIGPNAALIFDIELISIADK
jgi:FKBP-type peptidyl-prolyl cis-trans isomerase